MENSGSVKFLYGTAFGRGILKMIQGLHMDRIAVWFLRSRLSRCIIRRYIKNNKIPMELYEKAEYRTFREFFLREKLDKTFDREANHLISPCDGWLSVYPIEENQSFFLKGSHYKVEDLIQNPETAALFQGGLCLVFRLCASDYHHYCYVDDGTGENAHYIEGKLHSVQPIACETYPVFSQNRRVWTLLHTEHFGPVVQTEIGALVVGGIVNRQSGPFRKGEEKGRFELSGSTIALFLQKNQVQLREKLQKALQTAPEVRVNFGDWVAARTDSLGE